MIKWLYSDAKGESDLKRRWIVAALCALLVAAMVMAPVSASASSRKTVQILKVTESGARLRKGPSSEYEVITSLKSGDRVFYSGKVKDAFCYVCTAFGKKGYVYKGYLKSYGAAYRNQIYYANRSSVKVYKKVGHSSRATTLSKGQHVIVYETQDGYSYIKTLNGVGGYVKKNYLSKAG